MVGLEEQYIGGGWIPPFLGESAKAASDEPATATKSSPLEELVHKESTTSVPPSTCTSHNTEPAAKK